MEEGSGFSIAHEKHFSEGMQTSWVLTTAPAWVPDEKATDCDCCKAAFSFFRRKVGGVDGTEGLWSDGPFHSTTAAIVVMLFVMLVLGDELDFLSLV